MSTTTRLLIVLTAGAAFAAAIAPILVRHQSLPDDSSQAAAEARKPAASTSAPTSAESSPMAEAEKSQKEKVALAQDDVMARSLISTYMNKLNKGDNIGIDHIRTAIIAHGQPAKKALEEILARQDLSDRTRESIRSAYEAIQ